jgi:hypothetical protein
MYEIAKELMEIVIKEAKAPLETCGAIPWSTTPASLKCHRVPHLEDLLKRLPGIESEARMVHCKSDGKDVSKLDCRW